MAHVRPGREGDLAAVDAIYEHYILHTAITFDIERWSADRRRAWFERHAPSGRYRFLVAVEGDDIVGYATTSELSDKRAFETSVEASVYLRHDMGGRGLGSALYAALFVAIEGEDLHRAYAGITGGNPASDALHRRFGFNPVGTYTETGRKMGRYWDVTWWEKHL